MTKSKSEVASGLAVNQFEFRQGKGTIETVEEVLRIAAEVAKGVARDRHLCILVTRER